MAAKKRPVAPKKRSLFRELMSSVEAMRDHREGRLTLKTRKLEPITVPAVNANIVRETREALKMRRHARHSREVGVAGGVSSSLR